MRHYTNVLIVVVMLYFTFLIENGLLVTLCICLNHVKLCMLRILSEMALDALSLAEISKCKLFEVMLETKFRVGIGVVSDQLVDEPGVTISGKEELTGHLVHIMFASNATSQACLEIFLDLLVFVLRGQVHD